MGVECKLALVVAVADNGVIGADNGIPWKSSTDMRHFREVTMGKPVVMGRRTWQSLKRPLAGRENIVVSRDPAFRAEGAHIVHTVAQALELAAVLARASVAASATGEGPSAGKGGACEIMVIGGALLYNDLLECADRIYHTQVRLRPQGDVFFRSLEELLGDGWAEMERRDVAAGERDDADLVFRRLERRKS